MAPVKLRWTRQAIEDLDHAYEYICAENAYAARNVVDRIEAATEALGAFPEIGRVGRVSGTRELVVSGTPFIIPYRVVSKQVHILALIHAARRWPEKF